MVVCFKCLFMNGIDDNDSYQYSFSIELQEQQTTLKYLWPLGEPSSSPCFHLTKKPH
jgi:hypothetical protein